VTIAAQLGVLHREQETSQATNEFIHLCRYVTIGGGWGPLALKLAQEARAMPRIQEVLKAAIEYGSTTNWASNLVAYQQLQDAFLASLRNISIFDSALPFMPRVLPRTQISVVSGGATGSTVYEASVKLVSKLTLSASQVTEQKTTAICAVTKELLRVTNGGLFADELGRAVAAEIDRAFIAKISTGILPITSNGGTSIAVLQDLATAIAGLSLDASSKVFIAVSPDICKAWAFKTTNTGELLFPQMTINGGEIGGAIVFPTDGVTGQIVCFDSRQIAASANTLELDISKDASVQMDFAPDSPATGSTPHVSFWQLNVSGVKIVRWWSAERLRSTAISIIGNVSYTGNSPA